MNLKSTDEFGRPLGYPMAHSKIEEKGLGQGEKKSATERQEDNGLGYGELIMEENLRMQAIQAASTLKNETVQDMVNKANRILEYIKQ